MLSSFLSGSPDEPISPRSGSPFPAIGLVSFLFWTIPLYTAFVKKTSGKVHKLFLVSRSKMVILTKFQLAIFCNIYPRFDPNRRFFPHIREFSTGKAVEKWKTPCPRMTFETSPQKRVVENSNTAFSPLSPDPKHPHIMATRPPERQV